MATGQLAPRDQRVLLNFVSWSLYEQLLTEAGDHPVRMTYDRGRLEFMSPSRTHEIISRRINRLIEILTEEQNIPLQSAGSTTWKQADLQCGIEPDECYYVGSDSVEVAAGGREESNELPPDLVIEVEVSRSAIDRLAIYGALGVREVWRVDEQSIRVLVLGDDNLYLQSEKSLILPTAPLTAMSHFLFERQDANDTAWAKAFRIWLRDHLSS